MPSQSAAKTEDAKVTPNTCRGGDFKVGSAAIGGACVVCAPDGVELEMLVIDPRFQRQGIGSDFVATLMRRAHEHGRSVSLRVLKVNPAKALYDRLGFVVVGEDAATYEMRARP